MFSEVYWHHAVRSATSMFARAFFELRPRLELKSFFQLSEAESISRLLHAASGTRCAPLLDALFGAKRELYKRVAEFSLYQVPETYRLLARRPYGYLVECAETLAEQLSEALGERVEPTDVLIDAPPPDREIEFDVEIYFPKEDVYRPLHTVSPGGRRAGQDPVRRLRQTRAGLRSPADCRPNRRLGGLLGLSGDSDLRDRRFAIAPFGRTPPRRRFAPSVGRLGVLPESASLC